MLSLRAERGVGDDGLLATKRAVPDRDALRRSFAERLTEVARRNGEMLLSALQPYHPELISVADLPGVDGARDAALARWDGSLGRIWEEWHADPQRVRSARRAMEERLLRGFDGRINMLRQRALGIERYVWRSRDDAKVRDAHADHDDRIFRWDDPPPGGHPGEAPNCRCYAQPLIGGGADERTGPVPPAMELIDAFLSGLDPGFTIGMGVREQPFFERLRDLFQPEPGVTVDGRMLDVEVQGGLAVAFHELGAALQADPQAMLDLMGRHGEGFDRLARAFGRSNPQAYAAAAVLAAAGAPRSQVERALTLTIGAIDRLARGMASGWVDAALAVRAIPELRWSDVRQVAAQLYANPASLPEAVVEPFRARIAEGDYAGALGYGLPEVVAGLVALGRVRRRAAGLSAPETLTLDRLRTDPAFEGIENAGPHAPKFEKWIRRGGTVELMPDGHFRYAADIDLLGIRRRVSVEYPGGYPDFRPFMTHPSGVTSVEIEVTGDYPTDFRRANAAAGRPEWGRHSPDSRWTWHHVEDARTMQLVPTEINRRFHHLGGVSIVRSR